MKTTDTTLASAVSDIISINAETDLGKGPCHENGRWSDSKSGLRETS